MLLLVNLCLVAVFLYLISRRHQEVVYDEEFFLRNPTALAEYQQMPLEFQKAFFRKHKDWIKEKYLQGESYVLGFCPNKEIRRIWLAEFVSQKEWHKSPPFQ